MRKPIWSSIAILLASSFFMSMGSNDAHAQNTKKKMTKPSVSYDLKCRDIVNTEGIRGLIEQKYNVNCKLPRKNHSPFFGLAEPSNPIIVTPLFYAAEPEEFDALIKAGAKVNAKDSNGQTVLYKMDLFSQEGSEEILDVLIKAKINVNSKDNAGLTALENAIPSLLINAFSWVEDGKLSGDDFKDNEGTQYHKNFALIHDYMKKLIAAGAKLPKSKYTQKKLLEMEPEQFVQALLASVDLNAKDIHGRTILSRVMLKIIQDMPHTAAFVKKCEEQNLIPRDIKSGQLYDPVKALIDAGAKVTIKDSSGKTPIFYVRNPHVLEALIEAKADVNARDNEKRTPLIALAQEASDRSREFPGDALKLAQGLIEAGADINAQDENGKTAAYYAKNEALKQLLTAK